jgi:flagellar secretion chaperone FliS
LDIRQSYREGTARGASPLQLVILLYEQLIEDMRQASRAIEQNAIEQRTKSVKHALLVLGHLQSSLDFSQGGQVATNLNQYYDHLRRNLVQLQFHPTQASVTQLITDLLTVRSAWIEVERSENSKPSSTLPTVQPPTSGLEPAISRLDWKG